jgi:hypothetical protein
MQYHRRGSFVSGCWIEYDKWGASLVWETPGPLRHWQGLNHDDLTEIDELYQGTGRYAGIPAHDNDWGDPEGIPQESPGDGPGDAWLVEWMEEGGLDPGLRWLAGNVDVPAHVVFRRYGRESDSPHFRGNVDELMLDPRFREAMRGFTAAQREAIAYELCGFPLTEGMRVSLEDCD